MSKLQEPPQGTQDDTGALVTMVTHHDEMCRDYTKFLITIEAAVVAAFWAVLTFGKESPRFAMVAIVIIAIFGGVVAFFLNYIVRRIRRWKKHYTDRLVRSPPRRLYPGQDDGDEKPPPQIDPEDDRGRSSQALTTLA